LTYIDFDHQTIVIATHEIDEIEALLDEVVAISAGRLIGRHNVEELRETEGLSIREWMKQTFEE
jgi:ABC-2 type transport system ATP-binding protein